MRQDGHDGMVVRQHNNQESHTDGIIVRHGQVNAVKATITNIFTCRSPGNKS